MVNSERPTTDASLLLRGFDDSCPGYGRLRKYASCALWLTNQFEGQVDLPVSDTNFETLTDVQVAMALFDDTTDTGLRPDWAHTYHPAVVSEAGEKREAPKVANFPPELTKSWDSNMAQLSLDQYSRICSSWNCLVLSMHDHKAACLGSKSIEEVITTRIGEAVSLADLYSAILFEEEDIYLTYMFRNWLGLELSAGNLVDSIMDYKDDQALGHRPWSRLDRLKVSTAALALSYRFLTDPMTRREDIRFMAGKFAKHYLAPSLKSKKSSL